MTDNATHALSLVILVVAGCGGMTEADETTTTGDSGVESSVPATDSTTSDAAGDGPDAADAEDPCATVGSGPGLEACCGGELCRGECSPGGECICYGAGAVGGCPVGAACCKALINGQKFGPICAAPQDCIAG